MAKRGLIKRFLPFYRPYKGTLALDLLCALVYALSGLAFPVLVRYLLNNCLTGDRVELVPIFVVAAIMLAMKLLETACRYFMVTVGHVMGAGSNRICAPRCTTSCSVSTARFTTIIRSATS